MVVLVASDLQRCGSSESLDGEGSVAWGFRERKNVWHGMLADGTNGSPDVSQRNCLQ